MNNQSATMNTKDNPLGYKKESTLLVGFAIPCIISMLVTALYNIVDQIFIGQGIGMLGNAATNIAFPLSTTCTAISLLLGIGSATNFSLYLGAGEKNESEKYAGNGIVLMALFGIFLFLVTTIFLTPMLKFFGATKDVLPYAKAYTRITAFGFPFLIANTGMSKLILADGSPRYSMISMLAGAIVNTILDPLFIFVFNMGMTGAALATITGQIISFSISLRYMFHFKTIKLSRESFIVSAAHCKKIFILGASACFNQIAMTVVQIVMNNTLSHYGAQSIYGGDIPLACAGIITKVNMIFMSFVIGISQGTQPVIGFNYGAKKYDRAKKTFIIATIAATVICTIGGMLIQLFPEFAISLFNNDPELTAVAIKGVRMYLLMMPIVGINIVATSYFQSIGKAKMSMFVSLLRQVILLIPFTLILPLFIGLDGVWAAGACADFLSVVITAVLIFKEFKSLNILHEIQAA